MRWALALAAVVIVAVSALADEPKWKEFVSKPGRFKVLMPDTPEQDSGETESDYGKGTLHMHTAQAGKALFGAHYTDFPAAIRKLPLKQVYDSSRDGAVANLKGKLLSEKDVKLGKYPGREIRIEVKGGARLFRARVFLVDRRLYQVVVFGTKETATSKDADRFLSSFRLVEK
jgi:hypothetical protein